MEILSKLGVLLGAYLIGAIPFGFLMVYLTTGKDVRDIQSGRTGGTNAMRAAGFLVGLSTAILDILKGAGTVWLAKYFFPDNYWLIAFAPVFAILGHNYSIFLAQRNDEGKLKLGGGAGGAASLGGSLGFWWPSGIIIFILAVLIFYFVGYASVTTISIALLSTFIFAYKAIVDGWPWAYAVYGLIATSLLLWSLRPNIKRLLAGDDRLHGFRKTMRDRAEAKEKAAKE
ncbi:MAG: glycerol-3-phosphate acyltransferase [Chloroflexi bacterium]|jgi:acyl phosphate:glycerol-3-phosphate acyltransferase|nr:glycerol-3-phosphate acyltransferase [Chloroflexota bacterium]MBT3668708.1 glycerol-3-phosphate acyltransferase [Chloroflexota bacterium]MBT4001788.1 glycerol-3-phosphate acyltransferase [Chloroflexota bacterium]MBT4305409.1 glycerol-3-phosphate acyltransferase [Chloroflexota bacterium]MBT4532555.1 glycerol-3-phosphate acyltransferase [Chloroflexota bacterium]